MEYQITSRQLTVYVMQVIGRIDVAAAPRLKEALRAMTQEGKRNFVLDLRTVSFIDSSGLGVLTSLLRAARPPGGDARLVVRKDAALFRILSLVRFDVVFELHETPEAALRQFRF